MNMKQKLETMQEVNQKNQMVDRNYTIGYRAGLEAGLTKDQWMMVRELLIHRASRANITENEELMEMVFKINQIVDLMG